MSSSSSDNKTMTEQASQVANNASERVQQTAHEAKDVVTGKPEEKTFGDKVQDKVDDAKEAVGLKEKTSGEKAQDSANSAVQNVKYAAGYAYESVANAASNAKEAVVGSSEEEKK